MYALAPLIGSGTSEDPWRVDNVVSGFGLIDLRPPGQVTGGWALARLVAGAPVPTGAVSLAASLDTAPSRTTTRAVESGLGLARDVLSGLTVRRIIEDICVAHGDDFRTDRWNVVKVMADNWLRIFCGGLVSELAVPVGGAMITDDFNRPNNTDMGPTWIEERGDWRVASNQAEAFALGTDGCFLKSTANLATNDHYAQIDRVSGSFNGVMARCENLAGWVRCYFGRYRPSTANIWELYRIDQTEAGGGLAAFTLLGSVSQTLADPVTMRVRCEGSTIKLQHVSGGTVTDKVTATDASYANASFRRAGPAGGTGFWDNFTATDLTTVVGKSLSTVWNTRSRIAAARVTVWGVRSRAAQARAAVWHVHTAAGVARATVWNAVSAAAAGRAVVWDVAATAAVTSQAAAVWAVLTSTPAARAVAWGVHTAAGAVRATVWHTRGGAGSARQAIWDAAAAVATVRSVLWLTLARVSVPVIAVWAVTTLTGQARVVRWSLTAVTASPTAAIWNAGALASAFRAVRWNTNQPATAAATAIWHAAANVGAGRQVVWHQVAAVTISRVGLWTVTVTAAGQSTVRWDVARTAGVARVALWQAAAAVPAARALRWGIAGPVSAARVVVWDVAIELQVLRPVADLSVTGWADQAGGTIDLWAVVDDYPADDADYATSSV